MCFAAVAREADVRLMAQTDGWPAFALMLRPDASELSRRQYIVGASSGVRVAHRLPEPGEALVGAQCVELRCENQDGQRRLVRGGGLRQVFEGPLAIAEPGIDG